MLNELLQKEVDGMFAQLSNQNNPSPQSTSTEPVSTPAQPVVQQTSPTLPVEQTPATPVVPTNTAAPVQEPKSIDLDAIVDSWDDTAASATVPTQAPIATTPQISLSDVAKVLNVQKEDDVLKLVEAYKQKAEVLEKVPEDLSKALEIAKDGGNYLEYLNISVVDWSKEDPITLYENYVIDMYTDPKSQTVNEEEVDKLLDSIDDSTKDLRGRELQRNYINFQNQRKAQIEFDAKQAKHRFEQSLKQAIDSVDNIAGFKLTQAHKTELYNFVLSGQDLKPNDLQSRVIDAGLKKYWAKMDNFRKSQIKNATKRELLQSTTFPKLNSTSQPANLEAPTQKYGIEQYIQELANQRGFK